MSYVPDWTYFEYDTSDLDAASIAMYRFADYIEDEDVLQGAKRIAMDDMAERFDTQIDPFGIHWKPLSINYQVSKAEAGYQVPPILTRTGALRDAATDEGAWSVTGESVWFNTSDLPGYWEAHEKGSGPVTRFKNIDGRDIESGEHGGLPQRRFIGLSNMAREEIDMLVGAWVNAGAQQTAAPFRGRTGKAKIVKGAGGRPQWHIGGRWGPMV